jgi:hypothetical protein
VATTGTVDGAITAMACSSTNSDEGQDEHDDHDQADKINDGIHWGISTLGNRNVKTARGLPGDATSSLVY